MSARSLPIVILGGRDRGTSSLPDRAADKRRLTGYKGFDLRLDGRPIAETVVARLEASGSFGEIFIAGPASIYGALRTNARVIDCDGTFGENLRHSVEAVRPAGHEGPLAFTTCDILPEVETMTAVMQDYFRRAPCDMWFPMIRAPRDRERLGASAWKPEYRIVPVEGQSAVPTLPGHLVIADTSAVRLDFIYRLLEIGYRTRNRPIPVRKRALLRGLLLELLRQDLRHVFGLRLPTLTWDVVGSGLPTAERLRKGTITRGGLERTLRRMFVSRRHRVLHPCRRVWVPILDGLSLAIDLDTEEEALELGVELPGSPTC